MRRNITSQSILLALWISFCGAVTVVQSAPFPGDLPGTEIGGGLPGNYEPSGAVWHTRLQQLFLVGDGGTVSRMNADGSGLQHWQTGGDLEGICVADPASDRVYVGVENPDSIREFDFVTGQLLRTFDLTATMQGASNSGLEGVTFVPDPQHPEGGVFYAGLQADGKIYVFNLPIVSSATSTTVTHVNTITPVSGRGDISGLNYDLDNEILYAVYDSSNKLRAMESDGTYIAEWDLPGNDQEGVAMRGCEIFIAEDVGPEFWSYGFPTDSDDDDGDGVLNCDDACPGTPSGTLVGLDGCEVTGGCINDTDCGDGAYCNGVEICQTGVCEDGTAVDCDDGVACTTDSCDEVGNTCTHVADDASCDDGSFCNGSEICDVLGGCQSGAPPSCPGQVCSDALSQCVDCLVDGDCGSGEVCSSSSGQCVTPPPAAPLPIDVGEEWRYFKGTSEPPATWTERGFDDATWLAGFSGFGYGTDCQVQHGAELADMQNGYVSVYIRHTFHIDDPAEVASLTLTLDYDDSFVAYVNGVEVARNNVVGTPPAHDQLATADHECSGSAGAANPPEDYSLGNGALVAGTNVIAIQGHNLTSGSSDFSLIPALTSIESPICLVDADCSDGLFCNGVEQCVAGSCEAGTAIDCDDGVACTVDSCNETTDSCDNAANDAACDDGLYCNGAETCGAAGCEAGTAVDCDDGVACTVDNCNEASDSCDNAANDSACDDGLYCNGVETCGAAGCETGTAVDCDDGIACTVDSCNEASDSCDNAANDSVCDDGLYCNGVETCGAAGCESGSPVVCSDGIVCTLDSCNEATDSCDNVANDTACDDGLYCNGAESCGAAGCEGGTPVECDDGVACTVDSCNEASDSCSNAGNDSVCDDGLYCNGAETCGAAGCESGSPVVCSDGIVCTLDSCNEATDSCDNVANDTACDDGLYCNGTETCGAAGCESGTPVECDDGIACTIDSCDELGDSCSNAPNDTVCDDGLYCNGTETCGVAGCESGTPVECDDGVACTVDSCNEATDSCDYAANDSVCDDGLYCNGVETCGAAGCETGTAVDCDDGVACTVDSCNEATDSCDSAPNDTACDDGLYCNGAESCGAAGCETGTPVECDDGIACTVDSCNESTDSCYNTADDSACNDGLYCNGTETCSPAGCEAGAAVECDDGVACTVDSCNEGADRCDNLADDAACDDGLYCNGAETCGAAGCETGTPVECSDGIACTVDSCDEGSDSCDNAPSDAACDDGFFCNGAETCGPAGCETGPAVDCDDGVVCTVDSCDELADSCSNAPNDAACNDGLFCNGAETCGAGGCDPGAAPSCPGGQCSEPLDQCVECLQDADCAADELCNVGAGICEPAPDCFVDADCNDGLYCNGVETCQAGQCSSGTAVNCDDGVSCTTDVCNESTDSCDNAPDDNACNDGFFCNGTEICGAVGCESGTPVDCDDGIACTIDSCDELADSCNNASNNAICDDGLYCNGIEACGAAGCESGTPVDCDDGVACTVDTCNESTDGCSNSANDSACDDGLYCNGTESCGATGCESGTPVDCGDGVACTVDACNESTDSCDNAPNDTVCKDGLYCNGAETCGAAGCESGTPVECDDGIACTVDSCNESADSCDSTPNDAVCDDGLYCNGAEICGAAGCEGGATVECDDGVACTVDSCNESTDSCYNTPNDTVCNDGLYCNGVETCGSGGCDPGTAPACPGGQCSEPLDQCVECLQDADCAADELCNVGAGICEPAPDCLVDADCNDGLYCNGVETCQAGQCSSGSAVNCGDGIACTVDVCNESTDSCDNTPNDTVCDDGSFCNGAESCGAAGCEGGTAVDCDDGVACTVDSCNESADRCDNTPNDTVCDDGLFCNGAESCGAAGCDPGTAPACPGGQCSEPLDQCVECLQDADCAADELCNVSAGICEPAPDCVVNADCDDGLYCNGVESCQAGQCSSGSAVNCSDGIACTVDACNENTDSCDNTPNDTVCDDGLFCNGAETCGSGGCDPGTAPACPGGQCSEPMDQCVECLQDADCAADEQCNVAAGTCETQQECVIDADCDDGDACSVDQCSAGSCVYTSPDGDSDDVADCYDNCTSWANPDQADFDGDLIGDACERGPVLVDIDLSGRVDGLDLAALARAFGAICGDSHYDPRADFDINCSIDGRDLATMAAQFGSAADIP